MYNFIFKNKSEISALDYTISRLNSECLINFELHALVRN